MLTCFSALLFLLYIYSTKGTVTVEDAQTMVQLVPTERLEWIAERLGDATLAGKLRILNEKYELFLNVTSASEEELIEVFSDDARHISCEMNNQHLARLHMISFPLSGGTTSSIAGLLSE